MDRIFSKKARHARKTRLTEAERALKTARASAETVEKIIEDADKTTTRIRASRERNGYAELFQDALQLAPRTWKQRGLAKFLH